MNDGLVVLMMNASQVVEACESPGEGLINMQMQCTRYLSLYQEHHSIKKLIVAGGHLER